MIVTKSGPDGNPGNRQSGYFFSIFVGGFFGCQLTLLGKKEAVKITCTTTFSSFFQTFLEIIARDELTDVTQKFEFDSEGVYHTGSCSEGSGGHDQLMTYLNGLPPETTHGLMRVSQANHWNKNRTSGMELIKKLQRTQQVRRGCIALPRAV